MFDCSKKSEVSPCCEISGFIRLDNILNGPFGVFQAVKRVKIRALWAMKFHEKQSKGYKKCEYHLSCNVMASTADIAFCCDECAFSSYLFHEVLLRQAFYFMLCGGSFMRIGSIGGEQSDAPYW